MVGVDDGLGVVPKVGVDDGAVVGDDDCGDVVTTCRMVGVDDGAMVGDTIEELATHSLSTHCFSVEQGVPSAK